MSPSAQAADSGGDGNGYQVNPVNAFGDDGLYAVDSDSGTSISMDPNDAGKDRHIYQDYGLALSSGAVITGIEVSLQAKVDATKNTPLIYVQLSFDGGLTWTTMQATPYLTKTETTYVLGSLTDTWGHTWSAAELNDSNFRIRIINVSSSTLRDFSLDQVAVRVTYH